jgi:hypothetical protein
MKVGMYILQVRDGSVSIATRPRAGRPGFDSRQEQKMFIFSVVSRQALGLSQPSIQCISGALSPGYGGRERI